MRKCMKYMLVLLSLLPVSIAAKDCDWSEISDKKNLARNISWSYEYYLVKNEMRFNLLVTNVYDDLYIIDTNTSQKYSKSEFTISNLADNQKLSFTIYSKECDTDIATKDIALPKYNKYHGTKYCEGISEFSSCRKWQTLSASITEDVLKKQTTEYRKSLEKPDVKVTEYEPNASHFYIFTGLTIFALVLLLIFIVREKHEKDFI